ncbi:type IV pilus twitching motility protein PilT [Cryobacterium sp. PH29-G1]|uniref:type IV pilus twitching motility protein PilT n=1 Tax=Cryobacterium sp. PH29-G1 TaxID=3046211 RepID=UPI0024B8A0D0|nr:type IV pilus twitching motility protein PilT [Cryobacterium sp. PH29-G1]MDJ0347754.1 type IV pilus twitching motility protein PilT [Cryobacterium sp. PH29-G1]
MDDPKISLSLRDATVPINRVPINRVPIDRVPINPVAFTPGSIGGIANGRHRDEVRVVPTNGRRTRVALRSSGDRVLPSSDQELPDVLGLPDADLIEALTEVVLRQASDLHVAVDAPPSIRRDGDLGPVGVTPAWSSEKMSLAIRSILTRAQQTTFDRDHELDFAYTLGETELNSSSRFRVNVHQQRGAVGAVFRLIPSELKDLKALGIPQSVAAFSALPRGLVLVAGPTGSGKSTTLAALVDLVNSTRADHIVTVEDPIEFLHAHKKSIVTQREVGHDTASFASALKHVLRQDPDVILIGELRDLETIQVALTAAETGHLVFATLHTQSAAQTIDRIIDVFPPHQQNQVRAQLAQTLQGVVCQTLVKCSTGSGRVAATEVLVTTPAIANLIREGKTHQIESMMQTGKERGMHTMDQHLAELVNTGQITRKAALSKAHDADGLDLLVHRTDPMPGGAFAVALADAGANRTTGYETNSGFDAGRSVDYEAGFARAVI